MSMLLSRAALLLQVISSELKRHQKALELDESVAKITFEVIIGKRSGDPVKVRYLTSSESDLTDAPARIPS